MLEEMTSRERVLAALRLEEPDRVPYCEQTFAQEIIRTMKGNHRQYSEIEISETFHRDNINYRYFRPPVYAEKRIGDDGREYLGDGLIKSLDDLKIIKLPDSTRRDFYEPAKEFLKNKGSYAANAHLRLGIMPTVHSLGLETFSYALVDNRELIYEVLDRYTTWAFIVAERICELGFDFLWTFDDMGFKTAPFFSPKVFREIFLPYARKVTAKISIPWIFHSDGNLMPVMDDLLTLGMNGLNPIEPGAMDIEEIKKKYGNKICICGNIDLNNLASGTKESVEKEVKAKIKKLAPGGGYIVTSANSIPNYVKAENVLAMTEAVVKYGRYPITV